MQHITNEVNDISQCDVIELAKLVQDESICFGCSSALYGLTKLFYDLDVKEFRDRNATRLSELRNKLRDARDRRNQVEIKAVTQEILELQAADSSCIFLKFFYINFFDMPEATRKKIEESSLCFARLDTPDTFTGCNSTPSDLWSNVYFITIRDDIMNRIRSGGDEWTEERKLAKQEQMRLTAHEMAHQVFRRLDPGETRGLASEENAKLFADEILQYRNRYEKGVFIPTSQD